MSIVKNGNEILIRINSTDGQDFYFEDIRLVSQKNILSKNEVECYIENWKNENIGQDYYTSDFLIDIENHFNANSINVTLMPDINVIL